MRVLPIPTDAAIDVFNDCISLVDDADLKQRYASLANLIVKASTEYKDAGNQKKLHSVTRGVPVRNVTYEELIKLYTYRMVHKNQLGRKYYDRLISTPKHGRCPLCGHRTVTTLDHHLPKKYYPFLAILPLNLVPACKDCNTAKDSLNPTKEEEVTIHPYFDNIETVEWLKAIVIETKPIVVRFYPEKPDGCNDTMFERIKIHFYKLKLDLLYSSQSADELINIKYSLNLIHQKGGAKAVIQHLTEQAQSRKVAHINSWQTALYLALKDSQWYCDKGFNEL